MKCHSKTWDREWLLLADVIERMLYISRYLCNRNLIFFSYIDLLGTQAKLNVLVCNWL